MKNFKKILFLVFLFFPFIFSLSACDSHPPQQKKQNQITKRILPVEKKTKAAKETKPDTVNVKAPKEVKIHTPKKPGINTAKEAKSDTVDVKPPKEAKANTPKKVVSDNTTNVVKPESKSASKNNDLKAEIENDKAIEYYISEGKLDPFVSPIAKENNKKINKTINRKLTPLEKLDLSQIKLVAVITMPSKKKNVAMVQESSGKGYMVKVGTYIGTNSGRIVEIKNDEIIIKERIKNFKGVLEDHLKPMKLQKKDNG